MAVIYQPLSLLLARALMLLSVTQSCCLEAESGELVMGGCQLHKLLFPCVTCALPPSHLVCPQTQSVPSAPSLLALCPQSDLSEAQHLPQNLFYDGAQGPALVQAAPDL